ncbi:MAG: Crp/Fnr family transcriptional regulator [Alcaligenaceae bacterium]|nr:Crp/Fnr family transcriptional regulator [Alcaligenaceae bacterium]
MNVKTSSSSAVIDSEHIPTLCVSRVPIFNHLSAEALAIIAEKASMRVHERGEFIHRAGDLSNKLFIVHKGQVKVYRLSDTGKEQLLRILNPGDFAGEVLFAATDQDSYAEVMLPSEVCTIYHEELRELLRQYPDISLHILAELSRRLDISEKQTATIGTASINTRLASFLLKQAEITNSNSFELPMNRKNLASYLGTTPETVSRRLGEFEDAGWITQKGQRQITILDHDALLSVE